MSVQEFVISRVFDAPRDLVWKMLTEPAHMKEWWGPKGCDVVRAEMDLRPGGSYLYGMKALDGSLMWGKFVYREVVPPEKLVFINSFSDEKGGVTRHPMAPTWPLEMLSTFTFEEMPGGKTKFTVRWMPYNATEEERATFEAGRDSMQGGWSGTLDKLAEYLKKVGT
ncbi:MAG: SRPBCC domain-containing protein [Pseudorhodoplanes sp.]